MKDDGEDKDKGKKCDKSREVCYIIMGLYYVMLILC